MRQLGGDALGLDRAAQSVRSEQLVARTATADKVVQSICPYCAVGCGQKVYVKDGKVIPIEGDPDSQISRGRLCPKGGGLGEARQLADARDQRQVQATRRG
jgi:formate dehydrogenase major subunit